MRRVLMPLLLLCLAAPLAQADDKPRLRLDGKDVTLAGGLQRDSQDRVWISAGDLHRALDVIVKPLIPRPPQGRKPDPRREREGWLLCGRERCATYKGTVQGSQAEPSFELGKAAKLVGYSYKRKGAVHDVRTPGGGWSVPQPKRGRIGSQMPDFALTFMDGGTHRVRDARGKRLLLVTWASWSPTRKLLDPWRTIIEARGDKNLILVVAALDVEGEEHVRTYAQFAGAVNVAIDRNAELARHLPLRDVGHWYYIDELGVLRAEGTKPNDDALAWIDLHLAEKPVVRAPRKPGRTPGADLTVLRERVAAQPKRAEPRLALLAALGSDATHAAERLAQARALVEQHPKSPPFAFRLAALLLDAGDRSAALRVLEEARRHSPNAWYLRKQYWALWQPSRYYTGPIDTAWEKQQRKREELEFGKPGRGRRRR